MNKLIMIDQKHRHSRNWHLDVPAWLFIATVMAISIVGFSRAEAASLYNYDFSIKQEGIGNSICYPGPTCSDVPGWARLYSKATGSINGQRGFLLSNVDSVQAGGYLGVAYRYWHPVTKLNNAIRFQGGCSTAGGYFMIDMYNASSVFLSRKKVFIPRVPSNTLPLNYPTVLTPFASPAGTTKLRVYVIDPVKSACLVDNIYIN